MYRITVAVPIHEYKDDIHFLTDILNDTYFLGCVQGHFDLKRDAGQFVTFLRGGMPMIELKISIKERLSS